MATTKFIFAASCLMSFSQALLSDSVLSAREVPAYQTYRGDGTVAQGWPAVSDWADFETM